MTPPNRTSSRRRRGFTLIELLLVLLIIALLAAIAIPVLRRTTRVGSDAVAASELASLLRHARTEARLSGGRRHVRLIPEGDHCVALMDAPNAAEVAPERLAVRLPALTAFVGPEPAAGAERVVTFGPGGADQAYVIELAAEGRTTLRIEITHPSGLVRLTEIDADSSAARLDAIASYWEVRCRHALP